MITERTIPAPRAALKTGPNRALPNNGEARSNHVLWLDKNEGTDPEYIAFIKNILADIPASALFAYPDCFPLYQKLARYLKTDTDQLLVAAGSDGIIRSVYEAFVSPGDTVIHPEPTFLMYSLYSKIYGSKPLVLDYEPSANGPVLHLDTLLRAIHDAKPRLVCLPNPGSPTGTVFSINELHQIIQKAGEVGAVMLLDEAYYPFHHETFLPWLNEYPHLVISRSFSKAWGLAGIRLGYGIANKPMMTELHKVRPRYEVGTLSVAVAERILDRADMMLASVARLNQGKKYFLTEMEKLGFKTFHAEGNFFHVAFGDAAPHIHAALVDKALYQKDFKHPALAGFSRFTTTTSELFVPMIQAIQQVKKYGNS